MSVSGSLSMTSSIYTNPLKNDSNITALKTFEEIIRTSIGPHGKLKVVQNAAGGHVTLTSSSQRFFHIVSIQNAFLKLIATSAKVHLNSFNDNGFCCALLTLKLITNSLSSTYPLPVIGKLFETFGKIFIEYLNVKKNACVLNMDLSSLDNFQSVISAILHSKPGCILREDNIRHLCILLMKAHLKSIPSSPPQVYHKNINIITLEGTSCDKSCLYEGLLFKLPQMPVKNLTHLYSKSNIKVVLFSMSLSGDAEFPVDNIEVINDVDIWDAILTNLKSIFEKLITAEIHVLACQKVVHPSLKKQLEDVNILVLDRLGYETTKHLEFLSGASNSSLLNELTFGYLTSIDKVSVGKNDFLLLSNTSKPFWTMLICNFNEQAVNETKIVCQQVIDALIRLLKKPFMCFGAGCTEIHTSKLVEQNILENLEGIQQETGCTSSQVLEALHIFLQSIADLTFAFHQGSHLDFTTETVFGHLWKLKDGNFPSEYDRCLCGQFSAIGIDTSKWRIFTKTVNRAIDVTEFCHMRTDECVDKSVCLDELSSKVNAYSVAFETASLLLRVSVCVLG